MDDFVVGEIPTSLNEGFLIMCKKDGDIQFIIPRMRQF